MKVTITKDDGRQAEYLIDFSYTPVSDRITQAHVEQVTGYEGKKPMTTVVGLGTSLCHDRDVNNRLTGRKIALRYALKAAGFSDRERKQVWEALSIGHNGQGGLRGLEPIRAQVVND